MCCPVVCSDTYARTKSEAEQLVLAAAQQSGGRLSVVSVRPHGLYGSRDPMLVPTLVDTCKVSVTPLLVWV